MSTYSIFRSDRIVSMVVTSRQSNAHGFVMLFVLSRWLDEKRTRKGGISRWKAHVDVHSTSPRLLDCSTFAIYPGYELTIIILCIVYKILCAVTWWCHGNKHNVPKTYFWLWESSPILLYLTLCYCISLEMEEEPIENLVHFHPNLFYKRLLSISHLLQVSSHWPFPSTSSWTTHLSWCFSSVDCFLLSSVFCWDYVIVTGNKSFHVDFTSLLKKRLQSLLSSKHYLY